MDGCRVAIQGFGNVGAVVACELKRRGASIVGVADVTGGLVNPEGLDVDEVVRWVAENRFLRGCPAGAATTRHGVLHAPCDVLIPAAIERQITEENAHEIDCRLVVEAANGPTTPGADRILQERGVMLLPDVVANAGGVTVSYLEWVQDQQKYFWDAETIHDRMRGQLQDALGRVLDAAERTGTDWRTAAQLVALERLVEALRLRAA
jgi:glutamate dehydrogenase (NAD(P)+)